MTRAPFRTALAVLAVVAVLAACGGRTTPSKVTAPGAEKTPSTQALETGAALMQAKPPLDAINTYLDGFHFHADDMGRQMEEHHYCAQLNEDFIQCVLYDGNTRDAKLVGVEYVVSERIFRTLPENEKKLWHSHRYEVKSGQLVAPGVPGPAEHALMEKLVSTYGKIWHTWDTDRANLPLGIPHLMMGFTANDQLRPERLEERDRMMGISTQEKRQARQDIPIPDVAPGADSWQRGKTPVLRLEEKPTRQGR